MKPEIIKKLNSQNAFDRRLALEELTDGDFSPKAASLAAGLLADEDRGVRDAAAQFLVLNADASLAAQIAPLMASDNISVRNLTGDTLVKMGALAVPAIAGYICDTEKDVRKFAIDLLTLLPAEDYLDNIAKCLNDSDQNVVLSAIDALGALKGEQFAEELMACYRNYEYTRTNVLSAFAQFENGEYAEFFAEALHDDDPVVQLVAVEALSHNQTPETLPLILEKLEKVNETTRAIMLQAVVDIAEANPGLQSELPQYLKKHLLQMLNDKDSEYVETAVKGLRYFVDADVVVQLIPKMGISEPLDMQIFQTICNSRINIVGCVIDAAETGKISLQTGARFALGLAVEYLQTDEYLKMDQGIMQMGRFVKENYHFLDVESKLAAVEIFGKFRLPEFLAVLRAALQDNEAIARSTALEMVQHTGTDQFEDLLAQLQSDEDENIRKLAVALS